MSATLVQQDKKPFSQRVKNVFRRTFMRPSKALKELRAGGLSEEERELRIQVVIDKTPLRKIPKILDEGIAPVTGGERVQVGGGPYHSAPIETPVSSTVPIGLQADTEARLARRVDESHEIPYKRSALRWVIESGMMVTAFLTANPFLFIGSGGTLLADVIGVGLTSRIINKRRRKWIELILRKETELENKDIKLEIVNGLHPIDAARFYHNNPTGYSDEIKEALIAKAGNFLGKTEFF